MQYPLLLTFLCLFTFLYYTYYFEFGNFFEQSDTFQSAAKNITSNASSLIDVKSLLFPFNYHHFDCAAIVKGRLVEVRKAERYVDLVRLTTNFTRLFIDAQCDRLTYRLYPSSQSEISFPLAYSIIVYKNPVQVLKLFRAIYRPWNFYCIHLDIKSKSLETFVNKLTTCYSNVVVSDFRENVKWGEISLLQSSLNCMTKLSTVFDGKWKYLLNIAGSDFPLKTNAEIVEYLRYLNGSSDIQDLGDDDAWKYKYSFKDGFSKKSYNDLRAAIQNGQYYPTKLPVPANMVIHKGSFSGAFEEKFVNFVLNSKTSLDFKKWLVDTFIPDEAFWSTLFHGLYKNDTVISSSFMVRYTHWGGSSRSCSGYYEHGLCVYGLFDLKWLWHMPHLFGHKFDDNIQPITVECMEELMFNRTFFHKK